MSQRKALIASIAITLFLAFSAIGIRAAMTDSPADTGSGTQQPAASTVVVSGSNEGEPALGETGDDHHEDNDGDTSGEDDDHSWPLSAEHDEGEGDDDDD
jgi:hypothetical protein